MTEFYSCLKTEKKKYKSLYGFGGRCLKINFKIRDVCMDFEPCLKVHNLASVHPKSIKLGQMTNLDKIFHMMMSVYRLVKILNSPQFPAQFRNDQSERAQLKCPITRCPIVSNNKPITKFACCACACPLFGYLLQLNTP